MHRIYICKCGECHVNIDIINMVRILLCGTILGKVNATGGPDRPK